MAVFILTTLIWILNLNSKIFASNSGNVNPRTTTVMVGNNVTLYCTIIKNSSEVVSWTSSHSLSLLSSGRDILREALVTPSQYDRLSISGNSDLGEYNLNFQNVQAEDAGEYSCGYFSVSQRQATFSPTAVLTVVLPPLCEYYPQNLDLTPGDNIQMTCTSQNNRANTPLTWLRNGQTLRGTRPQSQPEFSSTIQYVLTEDDYDQPFTCMENLGRIQYIPHCFVTPLRQTRKPAHIVNVPNMVTVGSILHLICLTNDSFDSKTYRWFMDSNLTSSTSNGYSFGPVVSGDNGTRIICEVHRDGELYGRDEMMIIVTPEPEATYEPLFGPVVINITTPNAFERSTYPTIVTDNTRKIFNDETVKVTLDKGEFVDNSEKFIPNPMEGFVIILIVLGSSLGVLLLIVIFCLAMVLSRPRPKNLSNRSTSSRENFDTSSALEMREPSDFDEHRTFAESNIINERIEAHKSVTPHYHTLEPDGRSIERKERRVSDCSVPYSVVSKNKKASKPGEGQLGNGHQSSVPAYAVTDVATTNSRRHMSAKRPLPERPNGSPEYKIPSRSYSESKAHCVQKKNNNDQYHRLREGNLKETPIAENSSVEVVKRRRNDQSNLEIETDYTEVRDGINNMQGTLSKSEEKEYEFTTVYDAQEDKKNNVLTSNPDSGYHDSSSTEGAEVDNDGKEGQRSETATSSMNFGNLVKCDVDDNLYASLEDCSV